MKDIGDIIVFPWIINICFVLWWVWQNHGKWS